MKDDERDSPTYDMWTSDPFVAPAKEGGCELAVAVGVPGLPFLVKFFSFPWDPLFKPLGNMLVAFAVIEEDAESSLRGAAVRAIVGANIGAIIEGVN